MTISELKDDLKILQAMGIKVIRTYNVQPKLPHAANILEAIHQLKQEDSNFEMYVLELLTEDWVITDLLETNDLGP